MVFSSASPIHAVLPRQFWRFGRVLFAGGAAHSNLGERLSGHAAEVARARAADEGSPLPLAQHIALCAPRSPFVLASVQWQVERHVLASLAPHRAHPMDFSAEAALFPLCERREARGVGPEAGSRGTAPREFSGQTESRLLPPRPGLYTNLNTVRDMGLERAPSLL